MAANRADIGLSRLGAVIACKSCIVLVMNRSEDLIKEVAREVTNLFEAKSGSQEIAQEDALSQIGRIFYEIQPSSVLDLGSGIGTVSYYLSRLATDVNFELYLYEINEYCQEALMENLKGLNFYLIRSVEELSQLSKSIEFVIIDDFISFEATRKLLSNCQPKAVFIEGHRRMQRMFVFKSFRSLNVKFKFKSFHPTPTSHKVGCVFYVGTEKSNHTFALFSIKFSLLYSRIKSIQARLPLLRNLSVRRLIGK